MLTRGYGLGAVLLALSLAPPAGATPGRFEAWLDAFDFNDYALSMNVYASPSVYDGGDATTVLYPLLSSFEHATTTDHPLFVREGYVGLRAVANERFQAGFTARVNADGYGATAGGALAGMQSRGWSVSAGALAGVAVGPLHADLFLTTDLFGRHNGQIASLKLAWPMSGGRLVFVPQVELTRYSGNYVDYYYGVTDGEATPERPAYSPGAATVPEVRVDLRWRFLPQWFLRIDAGYSWLPGAMANSPIVAADRDHYVAVGVAWDSGAFVRLHDDDRVSPSTWEMGIEAFFMRASSTVVLSGNDGEASGSLERDSGFDTQDVGLPLSLEWRIGRFHTLNARYFELYRDGAVEIAADRQVGSVPFAAGARLRTRLATRVLRLSYGFAVFRDAQKELIVSAGLHGTRFDFSASAESGEVDAATTAIMPLVGASLRANFSPRLAMHIGLELFGLEFDRAKGSLVDLAVEGRYRLSPRFDVGAGYRYYRQSLDSGDDRLRGDVTIEYRGPLATLRYRFP